MNPLSIRARSYRTFESLELDLPAGCLAIVGSNGAGKSSIVNIVDLCLFGPETRSLGDYLTDDAASTELLLELTFEHAGETYRVRRGFSARGRGKTTLDFEIEGPGWHVEPDEHGDPMQVQSPPEWEPLTRESQKETQAAIEAVLGLSRETFRASAFLAQGDGAAFTEAAPRDRKRILGDVLGLAVWEALSELNRATKRSLERERDELAGRIAVLVEQGGDIERLTITRNAAEALVSHTEHEHATAEQALTAAGDRARELEQALSVYSSYTERVATAQAQLSEKQAIVDRAAAATLRAVEVQRQIDDAGDPAARVTELEERTAAIERQRTLRRERENEAARLRADVAEARREATRLGEERDAVSAQLQTLTVTVADLNDPANAHTCPVCEQTLAGDAHTTALSRVREQRDDAERRVTAYTGRIDKFEERIVTLTTHADGVEVPEAPDDVEAAALAHELANMRQVVVAVAALRSERGSLEAQIGEVTPEVTAEVARLADALVSAQEALAEVTQPEPDTVDSAKATFLHAKSMLDAAAAKLTESRASFLRADSALENAQKIAGELKTARARDNDLLGELDIHALAERAYGRDGIPAHIVENRAVPSIETEADRILAALGTPYRVELRTQRALKSGDGIADTLDVVVIGEAGERPYETFSGGERTRINLALRIALARLLAHRRGAESRLLAIDEPEFLDEAGTAKLAEVLRGLEGEFDRIVLVSHVPALRDAFDQAIEVVKDGNRSAVIA